MIEYITIQCTVPTVKNLSMSILTSQEASSYLVAILYPRQLTSTAFINLNEKSSKPGNNGIINITFLYMMYLPITFHFLLPVLSYQLSTFL